MAGGRGVAELRRPKKEGILAAHMQRGMGSLLAVKV